MLFLDRLLLLQGVAGHCRALQGAPLMSLSVTAATLESFFVIERFSALSRDASISFFLLRSWLGLGFGLGLGLGLGLE